MVGNTLTGNTGSAVFFEISDDLLLADNYIKPRVRRRSGWRARRG